MRFLLLALALAPPAVAQTRAAPLPLVPYPAQVETVPGQFAPSGGVRIGIQGSATPELLRLRELAGAILPGATTGPAPNVILHLTTPRDPAAESYRLEVTRERILLGAPSAAGLFYGLQTLRQLADAGPIPAVTISDAPRFPWRGLHLDVARHFFDVAFVKRYIDLMARFKFNRFHWHLTDDQGWRIAIRAFPRLTTVGGCRKETILERNFSPYVGDKTPYCGHYTQAQIREVVAYAKERFVTVVPEIEMPGHAQAALAAYPPLACTPGPFEVSTVWGVDEDIFCPSERTFRFVNTVLTEVARLFPGPWVHIGGDEAPKARWKASPIAQAVLRREGLRNEEELQSYFIRRVERMLAAKGKRLIGWDEILEGGLAPNAMVMSWRGMGGGLTAARQGHDVIMSPTSHAYFDYYQGDPRFEPLAIGGLLPLDLVYAFEPVPDSVAAATARHIIGVQANIWSEYLKTPQAVEYMAYPRALALSEVAWSPKHRRSWEGFTTRLPAQLAALDRLGVGYRIPHVEGLESDRLTLEDTVMIALRSLLPSSVIRYTTDGTDPTPSSPRYDGPFVVRARMTPTTVTARAFTPDGRVSAPRAAAFSRTMYRAPEGRSPENLSPGLRATYSEVSLRSVRSLDTVRVIRQDSAPVVARLGNERPEHYARIFRGYLRIPVDGLYTFVLRSDDGSRLAIGDRVVIDHDGPHGTEDKHGMIALMSGLHPLEVRYFQAGGGAELLLLVRDRSGALLPVPASWFGH
jgi:hexosaminidase